jgi:predicted metalloenzyme YecM
MMPFEWMEVSPASASVPTGDILQRTLLERHATANLENVWNGRPISKILLDEPLEVLDGATVPLIKLTATGPDPLPR